ncbi:MAG TPA: dual specificity protein phosphatase [Polyangia bacterium]|nr:dual specificity protein phosphatase [Polyangia bacterium]
MPPRTEVIVRSDRDRGPASSGRPAIRMNFDWLTDRLAIGGWFSSETVELLATVHGISRVVDLRGEDCDDELALARHGIRLLHVPTEDCSAIDPEDIARGVAWVQSALRARHRVLIHCQHGVGRSALLALCVLIDGGMSPVAAVTLAKDARAAMSPTPGQLRALLAFAAERCPGRSWTMPSFDELAAIAYRHLPRKAGEVRSATAGG